MSQKGYRKSDIDAVWQLFQNVGIPTELKNILNTELYESLI